MRIYTIEIETKVGINTIKNLTPLAHSFGLNSNVTKAVAKYEKAKMNKTINADISIFFMDSLGLE